MKRILIIILIFFLNQYANGQVYVGLSSGVSISKLRVYDGSNAINSPKCKKLIGFDIDASILFKLNKYIAIQSGLSYLNMGTKIDGSQSLYRTIDQADPIYQSLIREGDVKYRLDYLSLPLTINFTIPLNKYSVYVKAGGYISSLLYGTSKGKESAFKRILNFDNERLNTFDWGGIIGIGATRNIGKGYLFFDAKYMIGLSNLNKSNYQYSLPFGMNEINNRGAFLNIGYMFKLSKTK
jgi:hypothetical protein